MVFASRATPGERAYLTAARTLGRAAAADMGSGSAAICERWKAKPQGRIVQPCG